MENVLFLASVLDWSKRMPNSGKNWKRCALVLHGRRASGFAAVTIRSAPPSPGKTRFSSYGSFDQPIKEEPRQASLSSGDTEVIKGFGYRKVHF